MLQERWPSWKVGLFNLELISLQECNFRAGRIAYDKYAKKIGLALMLIVYLVPMIILHKVCITKLLHSK